MKRFFDPESKKTTHYKLYIDSDIPDRAPAMKSAKGNVGNGIVGVEVNSLSGQQLIYQYYEDKYLFKAKLIYSDSNDPNLASKISAALEDVRKTKGDVRVPFFISGYGNHTAPLIYIREGEEEAILYADSLGKVESQSRAINALTKIPVYTVNAGRQMDYHACHTDTMVFLRQATGKKSGDELIIPNLLSFLKQNSQLKTNEQGEYYIAKLPHALLITSQSRGFIDKNRDPENKMSVHKDKDLDTFREQYNIETSTRTMDELFADITALQTKDPQKEKEEMEKEKKGLMNLYLYKKGIKYADIVEIQFYLEEINEQLNENHPSPLTDEQKKDFISKAKAELKTQGPITHYISEKPLVMSRPGLHQFAENYLENILKTNKSEFFEIL